MSEPERRYLSSSSEIIASLERYDGKYKREEMEAAMARKDEIVPRLIELLEKVLADPERFAGDQSYDGHIYALMLLGHFCEPQAHQIIIRLFSLPPDLPYHLFGDITTEDLPVILLRTCNGSLEAIKGLVLDGSADEYCRCSAVQAIAYGVVDGIVTREEALSFFGGLLARAEDNTSGHIYDEVAACVCDLYPEELMQAIEEAYKNGYIDPGHVGLDEFRRAMAKGKEECLRELQNELERRSLDDLHESMSGWACFRNEPQRWKSTISAGKKASAAVLKKAKRKLAKVARKKNRKGKK